MPSFYVYIIECIDKKRRKSYYTGYTNNLKKRFQLHTQGKGAKYTKGKDLTLIYSEIYPSRSEAVLRELEIKKLTKKQKKELIQQGELNNPA
ncbi:MAG: GIY-YIG nuclease family protein [Candidatus Lokiarchaeota archaeon]|nr:GIY-YIG nuclease family protein [Candidatus Lokiarchaeota archaeon]